MRLAKLLFISCLVLWTAVPAAAQVHNAILEAVVTDADGAALPGVTVTATKADTGLVRTTVTGPTGQARLTALPPGEYDVGFNLEGLNPVTERVALQVGQTARIKATMSMTASEEITVSAETPLVDVLKTDSSTNIVPEQIDSLPVADRDFQRLAFIAPGVQRERGGFRFIQGGPVIGAGGNASRATILVDGVDFTDPTLGLARARFSQDAIQEFRVLTNRFDTEIGGSAGGGLSVITRSGGNDLAGRVFAFVRDDSLREPGALEQEDRPFSREQFGLALGGPFVRNQTHWFVSLERIDEDNTTLFRPQGAFANLADDVAHPFEQLLGFGSVTHQIGPSQTLGARLIYDDFEEENFRVGGIVAPEAGQTLLRENLNLSVEHTAILGTTGLNELHFQYGDREFFEPTNSDAVSEWFSNGTTLQTGANILGDLLGEGQVVELRDTYHWSAGPHELKVGAGIQDVEDRSIIDVFEEGLFTYLTDTRALPIAFLFGEGSSDVTVTTTRYSAFVHDDWRPRPDLTLSLGVRYDLDTDGNNPDIEHPLVPGGRDTDDDNFQPRFGFSWDLSGQGTQVLRGGAGLFTGRYLLIPALTELQQNGVSGRIVRRNLNGVLFGLPPIFALDPNNPFTTGLPLPPDISLIDTQLDAPEATQLTLGFTQRIFRSGLYFDAEAIYVDGDDEIIIRDTNFGGNDNPVRLNPAFSQINTYTNEGSSIYKALVLSLNGTLPGGYLLNASATFSDKRNISDDFSPVFPFGYPSDPADIDAEYGRSRADEPFRFVASAVFRLPYRLTVSPILEYGDGQPWNRLVGVDVNGDGKNSDRLPGVDRNSEDGPEFKQLSLRLARAFQLPNGDLEVILEAFNVTDETNFDVTSIDTAEFLSFPTLANPALPVIENPNFGLFSSTFPGREIQLGLRWRF